MYRAENTLKCKYFRPEGQTELGSVYRPAKTHLAEPPKRLPHSFAFFAKGETTTLPFGVCESAITTLHPKRKPGRHAGRRAC
jgi:hypothetical protein